MLSVPDQKNLVDDPHSRVRECCSASSRDGRREFSTETSGNEPELESKREQRCMPKAEIPTPRHGRWEGWQQPSQLYSMRRMWHRKTHLFREEWCSVKPHSFSRRSDDTALVDQIVVVDTETTGLGHMAKPPRRDGIVQVGLAYRDIDKVVRTWSVYCNPGDSLLRPGWADEALAVNGLTRDRVRASPPVEVAAQQLHGRLAAIRQTSGKSLELRAFNRDFDEPFLAAQPWSISQESWGPCIMRQATVYLEGLGAGWVGLRRATKRLGIVWPAGPPHDAGVDSHAALLVLEELLNRSDGRQLGNGRSIREEGEGIRWVPIPGCQFCESDGPHDGDHGYFRDGDFYSLR